MSKDVQIASILNNWTWWEPKKIRLVMYLMDRESIELHAYPMTDRCRWYKRSYKFTNEQIARFDPGTFASLSLLDLYILVKHMHTYWDMSVRSLVYVVSSLPEWVHAQERKRAYVTIEDILLVTLTLEKINNFRTTKGTDEFKKLNKMDQARYIVQYQATEARRWLKETRFTNKMES